MFSLKYYQIIREMFAKEHLAMDANNSIVFTLRSKVCLCSLLIIQNYYLYWCQIKQPLKHSPKQLQLLQNVQMFCNSHVLLPNSDPWDVHRIHGLSCLVGHLYCPINRTLYSWVWSWKAIVSMEIMQQPLVLVHVLGFQPIDLVFKWIQ